MFVEQRDLTVELERVRLQCRDRGHEIMEPFRVAALGRNRPESLRATMRQTSYFSSYTHPFVWTLAANRVLGGGCVQAALILRDLTRQFRPFLLPRLPLVMGSNLPDRTTQGGPGRIPPRGNKYPDCLPDPGAFCYGLRQPMNSLDSAAVDKIALMDRA